MNGFSPFLKKEFFELWRRGRLILFGVLFVFFGIEAPAIAKLTPYLFKMMSEDMEQQGLIVKEVTSTAASSYEQFFSNLLMILIVFIIVYAGSVTNEFSKGSAIPLLTKGLSRSALILSKLVCALLTWSAGLWLCFGITYGYTRYYWNDNSVQSVMPAVLLWWLFSVMVICVMFFFASFAKTHIQVMIGTGETHIQVMIGAGGIVFIMSVASIAELVKKYLPISITNSMDICTGKTSVTDILPAIIIACVITVLSAVFSVLLIRKRKI